MPFKIQSMILSSFSLIALSTAAIGAANMDYLESLRAGQEIAGFTTENIYVNGSDRAMGGRFISQKYGFIVDLLSIQSAPQAFFWVKTPPKWDKGEPHTCEHLLLGKGRVGTRVAALETMSLGESSAYTAQLITAYHFHTVAGVEAFFTLFEAKLNALLNPDFTDEEIRREVSHVGVVEDETTRRLSLEEKGTVYTEMVTAFEKPWYYLEGTLDEMVFGADHPLANISGGEPAAIRTMVAEDLREFHLDFYRPSNMGAIVSIPDDVPVNEALSLLSAVLDRCSGDADPTDAHGISVFNLQEIQPADAPGTIKIVDFPSENPYEAGEMMLSWAAAPDYELTEDLLRALFIEAFAGGPTSILYDAVINTQTRELDIGAKYVYGTVSELPGHPLRIGFGGVDNAKISRAAVEEVQTLIREKLEALRTAADGSPDLKRFNENIGSRLAALTKRYDQFLNSPPMFGFRRGPGGAWLSILEVLEKESGFRKSLVRKPHVAAVNELLSSDKNFWHEYIDKWQLATEHPYAVAIKPSSELVKNALAEKQVRIAGYFEDLRRRYGTDDEQKAIAAYKAEFDSVTADLEARMADVGMPKLIDNPPLTADDPLDYEVLTLANGVPVVASTFENMTSATIGIALRLDVIPEQLLGVVPFLPAAMADIGVYRDGKAIEFDEMRTRLRREVLGLSAGFGFGLETGRVELTLKASGSNRSEILSALEWMEAALFSPYLSALNLPRILDVIDQQLVSLRAMTQRSEEAWVDYPTDAYRLQDNPLFMTANCFLTQTNDLRRLRWQLTDAGDKASRNQLGKFLGKIQEAGRGKPRQGLIAALDQALDGFKPRKAKSIAAALVNELKASLQEIPEQNLAADWEYLTRTLKSDLLSDPQTAIDDLNYALRLIRNAGNARMFVISNRADREAAWGAIEEFAGGLESAFTPQWQSYSSNRHIIDRMRDRVEGEFMPVYVGLVNENTRNGVLLFSAPHAGSFDSSSDAVLDALAGKIYSGGAAHTLFSRTWSAGLAYSNGIRHRDQSGRVNYYAERCPDVALTMRFVVDVLNEELYDPTLAEYAVALVFGRSRSAQSYEARGEAMAADIADGFTPEVVSNYRRAVLDMRNMDGLYDQIRRRMKRVYSKVLIGYGDALTTVPGGNYFLIGPQLQFESLEKLIAEKEGSQMVYRLYPRDYWLVR